MPAVSNASPLIIYSRIGHLDLLGRIYGTVFVPPAVWREVVEDGAGRLGVADVARAGWLHRVRIAPSELLSQLSERLGAGEAEAIALAGDYAGGVPVLLDDRRGRQIADELGLPVVGSAGILLAAKDLGLIDAARPLLEALRRAGLHLSDRAFIEVLRLAGEEADDHATGPRQP